MIEVVIPFCPSDDARALELLRWIEVLGGCHNHHCSLLADASVSWESGIELLIVARRVFASARLDVVGPFDDGWPVAANRMFLAAADRARAPFLWLEPDCVPLKKGWMDEIERAYQECGHLFMGRVTRAMLKGVPCTYLPGAGSVWPADSFLTLSELIAAKPDVAFDVAVRIKVVPEAWNTLLVHYMWGAGGDNGPVFTERVTTGSPANVMTLEQIHPKAVLFHRNKDGSLIRLLRNRFLPHVALRVVLPFCNKDSDTLLQMLRWLDVLHGMVSYKAVLCYPTDTLRRKIEAIRNAAGRVFGCVESLAYPGSSTCHWPLGPNGAWQAAARAMANGTSAWLFLEPDAIALKAAWLDRLAERYHRSGKAFMGAIVPGMNHCNGVAIYPADAAVRCPKAMRASDVAWDWVMKDEMMADCHDASDLIFHVWGIVNGKPHPSSGALPHFATVGDVRRWIPPGAVLCHRCKDNSLTERLYEDFHSGCQLFAGSALAQALPG